MIFSKRRRGQDGPPPFTCAWRGRHHIFLDRGIFQEKSMGNRPQAGSMICLLPLLFSMTACSPEEPKEETAATRQEARQTFKIANPKHNLTSPPVVQRRVDKYLMEDGMIEIPEIRAEVGRLQTEKREGGLSPAGYAVQLERFIERWLEEHPEWTPETQ